MPPHDCGRGEQGGCPRRTARRCRIKHGGRCRISAANLPRSAQSRRGLGLVLRSTATSRRRTSSSMSLARRGAAEQHQPTEEPTEDQIGQRAPRGAVGSDGGERPSVLCRRGGGVKLAAADPGIAGVGGSSRDKVGSVQDCRMGRAR